MQGGDQRLSKNEERRLPGQPAVNDRGGRKLRDSDTCEADDALDPVKVRDFSCTEVSICSSRPISHAPKPSGKILCARISNLGKDRPLLVIESNQHARF